MLAGAFAHRLDRATRLRPARATASASRRASSRARCACSTWERPRDGSRIAFTSGGRREDLYTLGADGTGLRQLTNDAFKDRGPVFLPDGKRLLIYSTRSGQYEAWTLQLDGSAASQVTRTDGDEVVEPHLSPDGTQLALMLSRRDAAGTAQLDPTRPSTSPEPLPTPESGGFEYPAWSSDGTRLAGIDPVRRGTPAPRNLHARDEDLPAARRGRRAPDLAAR